MMSQSQVISKLCLMGGLPFPKEVIDNIKSFTFKSISKIPKTDHRYELLSQIPLKTYDEEDGTTFVYLSIKEDKDYFLTFVESEIQIQTFQYVDNYIYALDAYSVPIM